ncbi:MAG: hypothetical protein ABI205_10025, partial [Gemmatimonadaceae bacterium]
GVAFDGIEQTILSHGLHIYNRRTFEHDTDRTFELDLIGATKQFDLLVDLLRAQRDVVSITTTD